MKFFVTLEVGGIVKSNYNFISSHLSDKAFSHCVLSKSDSFFYRQPINECRLRMRLGIHQISAGPVLEFYL